MIQSSKNRTVAITVVCGLILLVMAAHWRVPVDTSYWHAVHLFLRKMLLVPVVLAAVWFNLRGALWVGSAVTVLYLPYVYIQWQGQVAENMNQMGELATVWIAALLAGVLVGKEKAALSDLAKTHEGALLALVNALDAREHDTQLHSLRVREYATRLGHELGMENEELLLLGQAALLHDVGKIGVPDRILLKPGSLTDEEWSLMREHPLIGRRILERVDFLKDTAEIVYSHHEKYDGSGYPRGLKADQIPLSARVFAIVDAFDALQSDRPYKEKLTYHEAAERIRDGKGKHFDPRIVDAFFSIGQEVWNEIADGIDSHQSLEA